MIDIRLNGQQQAAYPYALLAGQSCNFTFANSGTVTYNLGVGFYNTDGSRDVWFTLSGSTAVSAGQTTTVTFSNPTIGQLLSGFNSSGRNWDGYYFDANAGYHAARFWFGYSGSWKFYVDGSQSGSGAVTLVSWVDYATIITFKVSGSGDTIQLLYPFGSFMYRNGPASWPVIQYVAQ
jgi:hypothetical protein